MYGELSPQAARALGRVSLELMGARLYRHTLACHLACEKPQEPGHLKDEPAVAAEGGTFQWSMPVPPHWPVTGRFSGSDASAGSPVHPHSGAEKGQGEPSKDGETSTTAGAPGDIDPWRHRDQRQA